MEDKENPNSASENNNSKSYQPQIDSRKCKIKKGRIFTIKKLRKKYKKNGLNFFESYFNALFVYYTKKSSQKGRKIKKDLEKFDRHPITWAINTQNTEVYEKNIYDKRLSFLLFVANFINFFTNLKFGICDFFSSVTKVFSLSENSKMATNKLKYFLKKSVHTLIPVCTALIAGVIIYNISTYDINILVKIGDEDIGIVKSVDDVENMVALIEKDMSYTLNCTYSFTYEISYKLVPSKNAVFLTQNQIYNKIRTLSNDSTVIAYGLYIDGKLVGITTEKNDIDNALESLLQENMTDETEIVEYANEIDIIEQRYSKENIMTFSEIKNVLYESLMLPLNNLTSCNSDVELHETTEYEYKTEITDVSENETYLQLQKEEAGEAEADESEFAENVLDMDSIIEAVEFSHYSKEEIEGSEKNEENEDYEEIINMHLQLQLQENDANAEDSEVSDDTLSVSHTLPEAAKINITKKIYASFPNMDNISGFSTTQAELVLKKTKEETYTTVIPYETEYIESEEYKTGTEFVLTEGEDGILEITEKVTFIGEEETERSLESQTVLKAPINKVVVVGVLESVVTGTYIIPLKSRYTITERFNADREEYLHKGIDMAAPYGTPIYATDGGKVVYAGYDNSPDAPYGIYVRIVHSNGIESIYAHMSEETVSVGDEVMQGQLIGKVGSTGDSTGNHLHFEMRVNGKKVDPFKYAKEK